MENRHGLSVKQLEIVKSILLPFSKSIDKVALFGSRANGRYRANSDIDIVLYGNLTKEDEARIHTNFMESSLILKTDIIVYNLIKYPLLKENIDNCSLVTIDLE